MKVGTRKPGIVTYRGRIYVIGGMGKEKDLNFVQILNPLTEEWEDDNNSNLFGFKGFENGRPKIGGMGGTIPPSEELCGKDSIINLIFLWIRRFQFFKDILLSFYRCIVTETCIKRILNQILESHHQQILVLPTFMFPTKLYLFTFREFNLQSGPLLIFLRWLTLNFLGSATAEKCE